MLQEEGELSWVAFLTQDRIGGDISSRLEIGGEGLRKQTTPVKRGELPRKRKEDTLMTWRKNKLGCSDDAKESNPILTRRPGVGDGKYDGRGEMKLY